MITLYGAEWCPSCKTQKAWLIKHSIPFTYKDVDEVEYARELADLNIRSVPVLMKDGLFHIGLTISEFVQVMNDEHN